MKIKPIVSSWRVLHFVFLNRFDRMQRTATNPRKLIWSAQFFGRSRNFSADRLTVSSWAQKSFDGASQGQHNDAQTSEKKLTYEPLASLHESGPFLTDRTSHLQMKLLSMKLISITNSGGHIVQVRSDSLQTCSWTFIHESHKLELKKKIQFQL